MTSSPPAPRSTFVTVLAWIFIVFAGFATLASIMQNVIIAFVFPVAEMRGAAARMQAQPSTPWFAAWMVEHFQLFFLACLAVCATTFAASIGLLRRMNWARLVFVSLMALGILWNIGGVVLMFFLFDLVGGMPVSPRRPAPANFGTMMNVMLALNAVVALAFSVLWGWIIKRLLSAEIRREFAPA